MVMVFIATFNNISVLSWRSVLSFIGGGNGSTWRKLPTYRKSLTKLGNQTEEISMAAMFFATHISRRKDIFRKGPHIHY